MKKLIIILLAAALLLCGCGTAQSESGTEAQLNSTEPSPTPKALPKPEPTPQPQDEGMSAEEQLGREIADFALNFLGSKYKYGGKTPEEGFDCSGLVYYVYSQFGYSLARVANDQARQGEEVAPEDLRAGDVLAFYSGKDYVGHVGIYIGNGYYLHAMGSAYGVVLTSLDDPFLERVYVARRFIGCDELFTSSQQSVY